MTSVAESPNLTPTRSLGHLDVLDATELRWFAAGRLPAAVEDWFTRDGEVGRLEQRCDTYRMDGSHDVGVKLRFQETLELKVRQSVGERLDLADGLVGRLETWRKWSPAEGLVEIDDDARWLDVHKRVIKRRYSVDGDECVLGEHTGAPLQSGVDVEVAAVTVGGIEAWTFAFTAVGPTTTHRTALVASWQAMVADTGRRRGLGRLSGSSCGYPEWLALVTSQWLAVPSLETCETASPSHETQRSCAGAVFHPTEIGDRPVSVG